MARWNFRSIGRGLPRLDSAFHRPLSHVHGRHCWRRQQQAQQDGPSGHAPYFTCIGPMPCSRPVNGPQRSMRLLTPVGDEAPDSKKFQIHITSRRARELSKGPGEPPGNLPTLESEHDYLLPGARIPGCLRYRLFDWICLRQNHRQGTFSQHEIANAARMNLRCFVAKSIKQADDTSGWSQKKFRHITPL